MTDNIPPNFYRETPSTDPVRRALLQLRSYGDLNQAQVRTVLPMWRNFKSLNADQVTAIILMFPEGEDVPPPVAPIAPWAR